MRTVVFLKGCPLRCAWCHNPELQRLDRFGDMSPERLAYVLARDRVFFETTGGGVTFSGGEPLLFIDYIAGVASHLDGIPIAIETCGQFDLAHYRARLERFVDLLLFDVKLVDREEHRRWTGVDNDRILRNLAALVGGGAQAPPVLGTGELPVPNGKLRVRTPLIPGITATERNLDDIARLACSLGLECVELLPYNPPRDGVPMPLEEEQRWRRFFDLRWRACLTTSTTSSSAPAPPAACSPPA